MTDSAASPRSRSSRSSTTRRRPRAAAASGPAQSRAAARPGRDATASDALRDEHTLDLFGVAAGDSARTDEAAAGVAVDDAERDAARAQQRGLGGFDRPQGGGGALATARGADPAGEQADLLSGFVEAPAAGTRDAQRDAGGRAAADAADERPPAAGAANEGAGAATHFGEPAAADADAGQRDVSAADASGPAATKSTAADATAARPPRSRRSSARRADSNKQAAEREAPEGEVAGGETAGGGAAGNRAVPAGAARSASPEPVARQDAATRDRATEAVAAPAATDREPANAERADSSPANPQPALPLAGGVAVDAPAASKSRKAPDTSGNSKPAASNGRAAGRADRSGTSGSRVGAVDSVDAPPLSAVPAASSMSSVSSAPTAASMPHAPSTPSPSVSPTSPVPSAALAVSSDLDAHLRPLADRVRALQSETIDLRRAADAEMRRVNRLLLALAVALLVAIVALVVQAVQMSAQRNRFAAMQQRIDRLVAAQVTHDATIEMLSQRQDELGAQVDRLTSRLSSAAPPVKRAHAPRRGR